MASRSIHVEWAPLSGAGNWAPRGSGRRTKGHGHGGGGTGFRALIPPGVRKLARAPSPGGFWPGQWAHLNRPRHATKRAPHPGRSCLMHLRLKVNLDSLAIAAIAVGAAAVAVPCPRSVGCAPGLIQISARLLRVCRSGHCAIQSEGAGYEPRAG